MKSEHSFIRGRVDWMLVGAVLGLLAIGTVAMLSAASPLPHYSQILKRHFLALGGGTLLFLFGLGPFEARAWRDGGVYRPQDVYALDPLLRRVLDELTSSRYEPESGAHHWLRERLLDDSGFPLVAYLFTGFAPREFLRLEPR